jgi:predicted transcriptional regulator
MPSAIESLKNDISTKKFGVTVRYSPADMTKVEEITEMVRGVLKQSLVRLIFL